MKMVKSIFLIGAALLCFGCSKLPGTQGSGYSFEGYNNSGYTGDYQRLGGFDDTSLQEERKERERRRLEVQD